MEQPQPTKRPLRYRLDRLIRNTVMRVIGSVASNHELQEFDLRRHPPKRILLVRANYRIGNALLTLPAITAFAKTFPDARIDFVGSSVARVLFENQPLNQHYEAARKFPWVMWEYPRLIRRLRANRYDLAVDVSCSQSGLASFIVGVCGARIRAGCAGKWDQGYNFKVPRLRAGNKYRKLTEFLTALGLENINDLGSLIFSGGELSAGRAAIESAVGKSGAPVVGIFVGGRKLRGKRWPLENFLEVVAKLGEKGYRVITFLGPEESDIAAILKAALRPGAAVICEPSVRKFAAILSQLNLFICCDSGPMHLACAVGVRVLAIFQARDVARWAPPSSAARVLSSVQELTAAEVWSAALEELLPSSAKKQSLSETNRQAMSHPTLTAG
jgi:heptosyltransferase-3